MNEALAIAHGTVLAEAGATPHQIAAVTGHKSLSEVERYTREAGQAGLAATAIRMIGGEQIE